MITNIILILCVFSAASGSIIPARDLGILCDGRTDDTGALNSAIESLNDGDTLQLPPDSVCPITNIIKITSKKNIKISGGGPSSVIELRRAAFGALIIHDSSGIILENFKSYSPYARTQVVGRYGSGVVVNASSDVLLSRVVVQKSVDIGVFVGNSQDVVIEDCEISETLHFGVYITRHSQNVTVQRCILTDIVNDALTVIDWHSDIKSSQINFLENKIFSCKKTGIRVATAQDVVISGNYIFQSSQTGIQLQCAPPGGNGLTNVLVAGNTIENCPMEDIPNTYEGAIRANTNLQILENVSIVGNHIRRTTPNSHRTAFRFATANSGFITDLHILNNDIQDSIGNTMRCVNDMSLSAIGHLLIQGNTLNGGACPEPLQ